VSNRGYRLCGFRHQFDIDDMMMMRLLYKVRDGELWRGRRMEWRDGGDECEGLGGGTLMD